jgi:hypothetical protein
MFSRFLNAASLPGSSPPNRVFPVLRLTSEVNILVLGDREAGIAIRGFPHQPSEAGKFVPWLREGIRPSRPALTLYALVLVPMMRSTKREVN